MADGVAAVWLGVEVETEVGCEVESVRLLEGDCCCC